MNGRGTEYRYYLFHNYLFSRRRRSDWGGESNVTKILPQKKGLNATVYTATTIGVKGHDKNNKKANDH